jgi:MFS family permease
MHHPICYNLKQASLVCFTAALYFFYEFIQLNMFNAINPSLMREFNMTAAALGHLSVYYFYGNILFLFPAGIILDRVSTRKVILAAMTLTVLGTFVFANARQIWVAELCRCVIGMVAAFCFLSCMRLASRWFPPQHLAVVIGLIITIAMLGGTVAQTPLTLLIEALDWRMALRIDALMGVVILAAIFLWVRDYPLGAEITVRHQQQSLRSTGFWQTLKKAVTNRQNWLAGIYTSCLNLPIFLLGAMWGSFYLVQVHGLTHTASTNTTTFIFIGTIIGAPVIGWFSDRIARRKLPMLICAMVCLVLILITMYSPHLSVFSGMLLFFALGFFSSGQVLGYPVIAESNPPALTGTASGLSATLIMLGGMSQPLFGWLMGLHWDHRVVKGIAIYTVNDYRLALMIIPIGFVIGLLAALLVRETRGKRETDGNTASIL